MSTGSVKAVRLERGAVLPTAAEEAAAALSLEFCDVSGFGELVWVELAGAEGDEATRIEGPLTLLDLKGRLRIAGAIVLGDHVCTVSRRATGKLEITGGRLVRAEVGFAEITFTPLVAEEDPGEGRGADDHSPSPASSQSKPTAPSVPERPEAKGRWAKAIAESERVVREARESGDFEDGEVRPSRGDLVEHRQFGRCVVVRVDDEHISLRKPDRRNVQLGLSILSFSRIGEEEGKQVYSVAVRPKR
jgi:predicted DNA-binding protein with PD1-like motif